jgi:hypothetical protein
MVLADGAAGQTLRGLKTVEIESAVSASNPDDIRDCNVDVARLKSAAARTLGGSKVTPTLNQPQATYFVHVVVLAHRAGVVRVQTCSVFIEAVVTTAIRGVTLWGSEVREGDVWRLTYALIGTPGQITDFAADAVDHITHNFLADWGNDN